MLKRTGGLTVDAAGKKVVRFRQCLNTTVMDVFRLRSGWVESREDEEWDIFWADVVWIRELFDQTHFQDHQRVNHFRNHYELTRKNLMVKNLKRMKKQVEKELGKSHGERYDFFPMTFVLPTEYAMFVEEFKRRSGSAWIMKPTGKAQGKGIFLMTKLSQITEWKKDTRWDPKKDKDEAREPVETYIAQWYIDNPYLIGGRKFDLRVYVHVASYSPLVVWLYRSGFARFSNTRFSMDFKDIANNYIHLTNVAVQKTAANFNEHDKGMKWPLQRFKIYLQAKHGHSTANTLFSEMENLIVLSLQSVAKTMINDKHCFELYGYDILVDGNLKPWLIEVNASPSMSSTDRRDMELKHGLLNDSMTIVDMEKRLTRSERRIGGFDLIWNDGPIMTEDSLLIGASGPIPHKSMLGCKNDRIQVLRSMSKVHELRKQRDRLHESSSAATACNGNGSNGTGSTNLGGDR